MNAARTTASVTLLAAITPLAVAAQWTWTDRAELSFVSSGGNSSATTFGVKNTLRATGDPSKLMLEVGGVRTQSSTRSRTAVGTEDDYTITETTTSEVTAEKYYAKGRYDRTVAGDAFAFGAANWDRNTFSGVASRFTFVSGVGNQWVDREGYSLRTDVGLTYTLQDNVAEGPPERFGGVRLTGELLKRLTGNTELESALILDENVQETEDLRADLTTSISVAMNENLALKTSLQLLYDNEPSFVDVPLEGTSTTVPVPLGTLDTVFTVALVINVR